MKRLFLFIFVFLVCLSNAYAGSQKVSFSAGAGAMAGTLDIALAKGFFEKEHLKAKIVSYKKGKLAFDSFLSGKEDATITNSLGIVLTDFDISKYKLIGTVSYSDSQLKIAANKLSGITKPSDLLGKKIGIPKGTTSHYFLCKYLVFNGISCKDVTIIYMKKSKMAEALEKKEIDAFCSHGKPINEAQKKLSSNLILFQDSSVHRKSVQLIVPKLFIHSSPKETREALKAILQAENFIKQHPSESVQILAKAKKYSIKDMDKAVKETTYDLSLRQSLLLTLEAIEQWAIDSRLVKRTTPRNYMNFIDYRPLQELAPDKVDIIR